MIFALQIAAGIWLGGLLLIGTVAGFVMIAEKVSLNRRHGAPWYHGLLTNT